MPPRPGDDENGNPTGNSASVRPQQIHQVLRNVLRYTEFRPGQERAMQVVVAGRDTLAVLPSGAGKSAIYQVAGQLLDGPVVIVSPLIALQRDQVDRLEEIGNLVGSAPGRTPASRPASSRPCSTHSRTERSATSSSHPSS